MLRNFPVTAWNSNERDELYKHRTLAERINSILYIIQTMAWIRKSENI